MKQDNNTTNANFTDILKVEGVYARGYGIISKIVMQDTRLTIEAKAIYAYICSYKGTNKQAFPSMNEIMHDLGIKSDNTLKKHLNLLKKYGYIDGKSTLI